MFMGLENIREVSGSVFSGVFGGLPILDFVAELVAPDREKIDYTASIKLGTYPLATEVGERVIEQEFTLPIESFQKVDRLLVELRSQGLGRCVRAGAVYAHEYLGNPQLVSILADYMDGATRQQERAWPEDHYAFKRDQVKEMLNKTLAHLAAGRLHLFHRQNQFKDRPDLKELFDRIDREQLSEMYRKKQMNCEYWS